jgi:hypothetical protein
LNYLSNQDRLKEKIKRDLEWRNETGAEPFLQQLNKFEREKNFLPVVSNPMSVFCFSTLEAFDFAWKTWMGPEMFNRMGEPVSAKKCLLFQHKFHHNIQVNIGSAFFQALCRFEKNKVKSMNLCPLLELLLLESINFRAMRKTIRKDSFRPKRKLVDSEVTDSASYNSAIDNAEDVTGCPHCWHVTDPADKCIRIHSVTRMKAKKVKELVGVLLTCAPENDRFQPKVCSFSILFSNIIFLIYG